MSPPPIDGDTRLYGVLGHPVRKSLSPAMHNAGFRALGINAVYVAFPLDPTRFDTGVRGLRAVEVAGFNLTVPHKTAILPLLDHITPEARIVGAVNTVRCDAQGMHGTNTDGEGYLRAVAEELSLAPQGKRVLLLGAGGAARGIAHSLLAAAVGELIIANRSPDKAVALAAELAVVLPDARVRGVGLDAVAGLAPDLLINATTVGMGDGQSPVELARIGVREAVSDIVYTPAHTPLLAQAETLGLPHANGIGMLLHQGGLAFEFWTGQDAPVEVMRRALLAGLAARG